MGSQTLNAVDWLKEHELDVHRAIKAGKDLGFNGARLEHYLFEQFSRLMTKDNVTATSLPVTVDEFKQLRKRVGIEFPRGRVTGQRLDTSLVKASDIETREFLAGVPDAVKQTAYRKAEKEATRLIEAIAKVLEIFPDLDKKIGREEFALAIACASGDDSRHDLISRFTLRILRKANLDMCEQVARTGLID